MRDGCTCAGDVHVNPNYLHALGKTRCPSVATIKRRAYSYASAGHIYLWSASPNNTSLCVRHLRALRTFLQFPIALSCHQFMLMHVRTCKIEMVR